MPLNVEAIRAEVRVLDYVRGTPEEAADWRRANADALFDMLRDETVPPRRIGSLWALLIAFVVLMASNSWLKGIFGVGEIAPTRSGAGLYDPA